MPIEFYCPGCGNLMRTPDETAGRKGRCPTCQLKVQIPASSVAASSSSSVSAVPRTAMAANTSGNSPEPIRFDCGSCGKTLCIAAANAGKKGKCPHCGELMSIPLKSPAAGKRWKGTPKQRSTPSPARSATRAPTPPPPSPIKAGDEKIEFHCSSCHEVVRVGVAAAGKKGRCPRCKAVIQIPLKSTSVSGLQPIPSDGPNTTSPRPQGKPAGTTPGLTPLPSGPSSPSTPSIIGLTPLPSDTSSGLTPLDDSGLTLLDDNCLSPLEPLGPANSGGGQDDGLFGIGVADPAAFQSNDSNPFAAPTAMGVTRRPGRADRPRSGLHTATTVCASLMIAFAGIQMVWIPIDVGSSLSDLPDANRLEIMPEGNRSGPVALDEIFKKFAYVLIGCAELIYLTVLAGAIQMLRFKTWGLGLLASILCMSPCGCLCFLGVPLGIWGIVMLSQGPVRGTFS